MDKSEGGSGNYALVLMLCCGLIILYFTINHYLIKRIQDKYGFEYNRDRIALGIPIIPRGWIVKQRAKNWIYWAGDEKIIGHKRKTVMFKGKDLYGELDVYNLNLKKGQPRLLAIEYIYGDSHKLIKVNRIYQIGHTASIVPKSTADSILKADNIQK